MHIHKKKNREATDEQNPEGTDESFIPKTDTDEKRPVMFSSFFGQKRPEVEVIGSVNISTNSRDSSSSDIEGLYENSSSNESSQNENNQQQDDNNENDDRKISAASSNENSQENSQDGWGGKKSGEEEILKNEPIKIGEADASVNTDNDEKELRKRKQTSTPFSFGLVHLKVMGKYNILYSN